MSKPSPFPVLALLVAAFAGAAPTLANPYRSFDEALAATADGNRLLLVDFYTEWCGPCKAFSHAAKTDGALRQLLGNYVLYKIDAEKGEGLHLAETYKVESYPTYVVLNGEGKTVGRWSGYDKQDFLTRARAVLDDPIPIEARAARAAKTPTAEDAAVLAAYHESRGESSEALAYYKTAHRLSTDPNLDFSLRIFQTVFYGALEGKFAPDEAVKAARIVFDGTTAKDADLVGVALMMNHLAGKTNRPELAHPFIREAVERTGGATDQMTVAGRKELLPDYALFIEKDVPKAILAKKASLPTDWQENTRALNEFAWWCFENHVNLPEAKTFAEKAVRLAPAGAERAMVLDTLAEICNALGDCEESVELSARAAGEDPKNAYYKTQQERFRKLLNGRGRR